ncbi:MAG: hypothetical protein H7A32_04300 [Deltaproteobacteria bacterium]|nr:hypothetical protein [Deltaproteobacteria bacterium]
MSAHVDINNIKERDLACIVLMLSRLGKRAEEALSHLSDSRLNKISSIISDVLSQPSSAQQDFIKSSMGKLQSENQISLFYHAHPTWVSEAFKEESSLVLAQIISLLPKEKVGMFLKDLSKEKRKKLRRLQNTRIAAPMREFVKKRCEAAFPSFNMELLKSQTFFNTLAEFNLRKFDALLQELGLSELTIAFSRVNRSAIRAILNRLQIEDAMEIKKRLKEETKWDPQILKEAQLHILTLDFDKLKAETMMQEIGFGVFSRAFSKDRVDEANYFMYRFPPQQGYMLKRYINSQESNPDEKKLHQIQSRILLAIKSLDNKKVKQANT